jgi:hypothetical protein
MGQIGGGGTPVRVCLAVVPPLVFHSALEGGATTSEVKVNDQIPRPRQLVGIQGCLHG